MRPLADEQTQPTAQHGLAHAVHAELDALIDGVPVAALADVLGVDERQVEHAIRAVSLSVLADLWRTAENDEAGAAAIAAGARRHSRRKPGDCAGGEEDDAEQFGAVLPIVADYPEKGFDWDGTQGGIDNDPRIRQLVMLVAQLSLVHLGNVVEDLVAAGYTPSNAVRFSLRTMLAGPPPRW
ncbi:hypothetical protein [Mycobacterium sp. 29Ha]|uniref:hypothetical protein n=1 Tax=Mycobacterium sp. 29Ha TaxID=2939268 RepID=UPI00293942BE|nr:hypothetical protein [Mycobacterium sp. 29Ha]MDV3136382.1 hypothetical protein [Mycobacterium sp. 29Ha]